MLVKEDTVETLWRLQLVYKKHGENEWTGISFPSNDMDKFGKFCAAEWILLEFKFYNEPYEEVAGLADSFL